MQYLLSILILIMSLTVRAEELKDCDIVKHPEVLSVIANWLERVPEGELPTGKTKNDILGEPEYIELHSFGDAGEIARGALLVYKVAEWMRELGFSVTNAVIKVGYVSHLAEAEEMASYKCKDGSTSEESIVAVPFKQIIESPVAFN